MKEVYIVEPEERKLADIAGVFQKIDPDKDRYRLIVNPFEGQEVQTATLSEIIALTLSGSLDLIVLPVGESPGLSFSEEPERFIGALTGIQMALRYKGQGYAGPVLLTIDKYFSATFGMYIDSVGESKDDPKAMANAILGYHFLNLYSTEFPEDTKLRVLLCVLERIPSVDVTVLDADTGRSVAISYDPRSEIDANTGRLGIRHSVKATGHPAIRPSGRQRPETPGRILPK